MLQRGKWHETGEDSIIRNFVSHATPNVIRVKKIKEGIMSGHVARIGEMRNIYKILIEKPEGKRPLGRPRRRWVRNIRMQMR
jgi:hypothetical protein